MTLDGETSKKIIGWHTTVNRKGRDADSCRRHEWCGWRPARKKITNGNWQNSCSGSTSWEEKGSAYDFVARIQPRLREVWLGLHQTGNHYLNSLKPTITKRPGFSGFALSATKRITGSSSTKTGSHVPNGPLAGLHQKSRSGFKVKETRSGINHNQPGQFWRFTSFRSSIWTRCLLKMPSPIARNPSWSLYRP